jgi:hypothetical protein
MSMDTSLTLPFGTADSCAWVRQTWGDSTFTTDDDAFYQPEVGMVNRIFHQEGYGATYHGTWMLTGSSRL